MVKDFNEFLENLAWNPANDVTKYIEGLTNRLILLEPEEVEEHRERLTRLHEVIDRKLRGSQ